MGNKCFSYNINFVANSRLLATKREFCQELLMFRQQIFFVALEFHQTTKFVVVITSHIFHNKIGRWQRNILLPKIINFATTKNCSTCINIGNILLSIYYDILQIRDNLLKVRKRVPMYMIGPISFSCSAQHFFYQLKVMVETNLFVFGVLY